MNRTVALYKRIKIKHKWTFAKVSEELSQLNSGEYYISWYEGSRKRMVPVGSDPEAALRALNLKDSELAYIAAGGVIKKSNAPVESGNLHLSVRVFASVYVRSILQVLHRFLHDVVSIFIRSGFLRDPHRIVCLVKL